MYAAQSVQRFFGDWLEIRKNWYRITPVTRKKDRRPRHDRFLYIREEPGNLDAIFMRIWWGRNPRQETTPIATWLFERDLLLINTDDHWGVTAMNRRMQLIECCEAWKQPYVLVSYEAARLAGIDLMTIERVCGNSLLNSGTFENAPRSATYRYQRVWKVAKEVPENVAPWSVEKFDLGNSIPSYRWWVWENVKQEPDADGLYYWRDWRYWRRNLPGCVFRADWTSRETGRRLNSRFVSAWDELDRPPRYFLSEIPRKARAHTVEAALESLAPPAVKLARKQGRQVVRQGDIFAIKTELKEHELRKRLRSRASWEAWSRFRPDPTWQTVRLRARDGARIARGRSDEAVRGMLANPGRWGWAPGDRWSLTLWIDFAPRLRIHGTSHTATEVITTTDGLMYGRGQLRHDPFLAGELRGPDHRNVTLDDGRDGWWLLVRNTVPQADPRLR